MHHLSAPGGEDDDHDAVLMIRPMIPHEVDGEQSIEDSYMIQAVEIE